MHHPWQIYHYSPSHSFSLQVPAVGFDLKLLTSLWTVALSPCSDRTGFNSRVIWEAAKGPRVRISMYPCLWPDLHAQHYSLLCIRRCTTSPSLILHFSNWTTPVTEPDFMCFSPLLFPLPLFWTRLIQHSPHSTRSWEELKHSHRKSKPHYLAIQIMARQAPDRLCHFQRKSKKCLLVEKTPLFPYFKGPISK